MVPVKQNLNGPPRMCPTMSYKAYLLSALFSHWKNHRPSRALSVLCHANLREGQCGQSQTTPLTLVMRSLSVFLFLGGGLSLILKFWDFHSGVLSRVNF